ncbi:MAG: hypothetical protein U0871_29870 [Gemmataceae bacterium]
MVAAEISRHAGEGEGADPGPDSGRPRRRPRKATSEGKKFNAKPANILDKIADGKLKTWMAESVLTRQPMANAAKYPGKTVGQVIQGLGLPRSG